MSHLRNRNSSSSAAVLLHRKKQQRSSKLNNSMRYRQEETNISSLIELPRHKNTPSSKLQTTYNQNVHLFNELTNSNDKSQLPFMASLRNYRRRTSPPTNTVSQAFDVASKETCNQKFRKNVSDFKSKNRRLATSYHRWHNKSGRSSLWSADFQCSLRQYGSNPEQSRYYNYIKPILHKDYQKRIYNPKEIICDRHRSFSFK